MLVTFFFFYEKNYLLEKIYFVFCCFYFILFFSLFCLRISVLILLIQLFLTQFYSIQFTHGSAVCNYNFFFLFLYCTWNSICLLFTKNIPRTTTTILDKIKMSTKNTKKYNFQKKNDFYWQDRYLLFI